MATTADFIDYVCEQVEGSGFLCDKRMFGEYLVYIDDKPVLLVCDNTVYVKILPVLDRLMENADKGSPYDGAKEHYILDIEDRGLVAEVIAALLPVVKVPQRRRKKRRS